MTKLLERWFRPRAAARRAVTSIAGSDWLIHEGRPLEAAFEEVRAGAQRLTGASDIRAAFDVVEQEESEREPYTVEQGVAIIPVRGLIMREVPCAFRFFGIEACSTVETQAAVAQALADPQVGALLLDIDSPGGTLAGTAELADDLRAARDVKPLFAHAADLAASAAYWVGAQASTFTAGATAAIGSIGVYRVMIDSSRSYEAAGLKVHRVASGPLKGVGVPGVEITAEQLAVEQELIDRAAQLFREAVLLGRPQMDPEDLAKNATGRVWFGLDAAGLGLVDGVSTFEQALVAAIAAAGPMSNASSEEDPDGEPRDGSGGEDMTTPTPAAATSGSDRIAAIEAKIAAIEAQNEALKAENEALKGDVEVSQAKAELAEKALKDRVGAVLDEHQARGAFDPADREEFAALAEKAYAKDPDGLDAFLRKMPSKDRREPRGRGGDRATRIDPEEASLAKVAGLSVDDLRIADDTTGFSFVRNERYTASGATLRLVEKE